MKWIFNYPSMYFTSVTDIVHFSIDFMHRVSATTGELMEVAGTFSRSKRHDFISLAGGRAARLGMADRPAY